MITITQLIHLAFQLGILITFEPVTTPVVSYYNEDTQTISKCVPAVTDMGPVAICATAHKEVVVYVLR
jgi:hypothetical protein